MAASVRGGIEDDDPGLVHAVEGYDAGGGGLIELRRPLNGVRAAIDGGEIQAVVGFIGFGNPGEVRGLDNIVDRANVGPHRVPGVVKLPYPKTIGGVGRQGFLVVGALGIFDATKKYEGCEVPARCQGARKAHEFVVGNGVGGVHRADRTRGERCAIQRQLDRGRGQIRSSRRFGMFEALKVMVDEQRRGAGDRDADHNDEQLQKP